MFGIKQHIKLIAVGIVIILAIVSASYFWLNTTSLPLISTQPPLTTTQPPLTCTINQTPGEALVIDNSPDNAIICTKLGDSVTLKVGLGGRIGGKWHITNSSGLLVSDGRVAMFDPRIPGLGSNTIEWDVTMTSVGTQTLTAEFFRPGGDDDSHKTLITTQNLTFVVR